MPARWAPPAPHLDEAGVGVLLAAGQGLVHHLEGDAGDHRHAVPPAGLPDGVAAVAEVGHLHGRELLRPALELLEEDDVGRVALDQPPQVRHPLAAGVHVEGAKAHGAQPTLKDTPQPQPETATGLRTLKWAPISSSAQSSSRALEEVEGDGVDEDRGPPPRGRRRSGASVEVELVLEAGASPGLDREAQPGRGAALGGRDLRHLGEGRGGHGEGGGKGAAIGHGEPRQDRADPGGGRCSRKIGRPGRFSKACQPCRCLGRVLRPPASPWMIPPPPPPTPNGPSSASRAASPPGRCSPRPPAGGSTPRIRQRPLALPAGPRPDHPFTAFRRLQYKTQVFVYHEGDALPHAADPLASRSRRSPAPSPASSTSTRTWRRRWRWRTTSATPPSAMPGRRR